MNQYNEYIEMSNLIYSRLGDEISRRIYRERTLYSLTDCDECINAVMETVPLIIKFRQTMDGFNPSQSKLIYGAGMRGKTVVRYWKYNWDAFIDQNPQLWNMCEQGLPIMPLEKALEHYKNPIIVITNRVGYDEIEKTLLSKGVNGQYIVNMGRLWAELTNRQYFDLEALPHVRDEIFVDLGVYDGYSSKMFAEWCKYDFRHIWAFEPDAANLKTCKEQMNGYFLPEQFDLINKATWNCVGEMSFARKGFVDSCLTESGEDLVKVTTLDEELRNQDITFIKMDIEGAEYETLQGAERLIKSNLPKLAISIYHKREDIFTIPSLIYRYSNRYEFYLRHYSFFDWDTVLYAVPKRK